MRTSRPPQQSGYSTLIQRRSAFGVTRLLEGCVGAALGVAMTGVGDALDSAHAFAPDTRVHPGTSRARDHQERHERPGEVSLGIVRGSRAQFVPTFIW